MSNTDNIRRMYSKITAPEDAVAKCLEFDESKRVVKFPVKRVVAIAACISILFAVAIPASSYIIQNGFGAVQNYGEEIQGDYPHKIDSFYTEIGESSLLVTEGSKLSDTHQGLEVKVDEAYYDGFFMYLSFVGEYNSDSENIDRFFYEGFDNYIMIDGEYIKADLTGYSFSLFNSDEGFGGVLGFIYPYNKQNTEVKINIPMLQVLGKSDDAEGNHKVLGEINEAFELDFAVRKSASSVLVYNAEGNREEVSVLGVTASKGGICVEIFVPEEVEAKKVGIVATVENQHGESAGFILGNSEETEGGYISKLYFEPVGGEVLNVAVYDKNNIDAGKLAEFRCFLTNNEL